MTTKTEELGEEEANDRDNNNNNAQRAFTLKQLVLIFSFFLFLFSISIVQTAENEKDFRTELTAGSFKAKKIILVSFCKS